jgi:DNA-binding NarL/FixJ family response regulator
LTPHPAVEADSEGMPLSLYRSEPLGRLTPRQREVLALIAEGYSNSAIAEHLVLARKSVENHINGLYRDLGMDPEDTNVNPRVRVARAYLQYEASS